MSVKGNTRVRKNVLSGQRRSPFGLLRSSRVAVAALILVAAGSLSAFLFFQVKAVFRVGHVAFSGNSHLTDEELKALAGFRGDENLVTFSSARLFEQLMQSPWIRSVSVRKELPRSLLVQIRETEPFALMDVKGRLFIVDEKGKMLEELKHGSIPFLPVISGVPFGKKENVAEALQLVKVIRGRGLLSEKEHIEIIAQRPQDMTVNLDGLVVKVGTGEYEDKLQRLAELEEEIRKRGIHVDYIDLRFENKAVVRPVNEVVR